MYHVWRCILIFLSVLLLYHYMCRFKRICKHLVLEQVQLRLISNLIGFGYNMYLPFIFQYVLSFHVYMTYAMLNYQSCMSSSAPCMYLCNKKQTCDGKKQKCEEKKKKKYR